MIEPLRMSFEVACSADHAFTTWTSRASVWWPAEHTMSGRQGLEVVFEPRLGGRIFERTPEGAENEWGQITGWDPGRRLAYRWHIATDRADATDVEIVFIELDVCSTRIEIEHSGWERLGAEKGRAWRDANHDGWEGVLPVYVAACSAAKLDQQTRRP